MEPWHPLLSTLALGGPLPEGVAAPDEPSSLARLLSQAEGQGVLYAVCRALPPTAATRGAREAAVRHDMIWEQAAARALADLPGEAPPILLKGAGSRYLLYDHPGDRTCVDLDLMVPSARGPLAQAALEARGWVVEPGRARDWHVLGLSRSTAVASLSLEIHRALDNPERGTIGYEALAPLCREMEVLGRTCLVPDPPGQLLVGATHALRHGLDVPLKSLVDIHRAVGACEGIRDELTPLRRSPGAAATLGVMLRLCGALFGTPVPEDWSGALAPPLLSAPLLWLSLDPTVPGYARPPLDHSAHLRRFWFQSLLTGSPTVVWKTMMGWLRRRMDP